MMRSDVQDPHPPFLLDESALLRHEWQYLSEAGQAAGALRRLSPKLRAEHTVNALTEDALASLELEGTAADRAAMERCVRFRLAGRCGGTGQSGEPLLCCVADLLTRARVNHPLPLTLKTIGEIGILLGGEDNASRLGSAAGSGILREFGDFACWFAACEQAEPCDSPVGRAGLAHVWMEAIHPCRFGSGILGRVLGARLLLPRHTGVPSALSPVFLRRRNDYYALLDAACRERDAREWLPWFGDAVLESMRAAKHSLRRLIPGYS